MDTATLEEPAQLVLLKTTAPQTKRSRAFSHFNKPHPNLRVSVIVPAKDEADSIYDTLESLRQQVDANHNPIDPQIYEVLLLINNTTDDSFKIADAYKAAYPNFNLYIENVQLKGKHANIGRARGLVMDEAYRRLLKTKAKAGIIASTDGDTIVDCQWICNIIKEIEKGNDAVGGRIITLKSSGVARLSYLRNITFRCLLAHAESIIDPQENDPSPRHYQYFGANMAVTTKMYNLVGKLPQVPNLEDMAFHDALLRCDAKIRRSYDVKVYTSDRTAGKVRFGFSQQLRSWYNREKKNKPQLVEDVSLVFNRYDIKKQVRCCWKNYQDAHELNPDNVAYLKTLTRRNEKWITDRFKEANFFGQLWTEIDQKLNKNRTTRIKPQPVLEAIAQLREFIKKAG